MPTPRSVAFVLALSSTLLVLPAQQEPVPPATPQPAAAPNARELLAGALKFAQSLPALRCTISARMLLPEFVGGFAEMGGPDEADLPVSETEATIAATGQFALVASSPFEAAIVSDGKVVLRSSGRFRICGESPAPKSFSALPPGKGGAFEIPGLKSLQAILAPAGAKGALVDAAKVELLGTETVDGRPCHHLKVDDEKLACELWIATGDEPWIVRHRPARPQVDLQQLMAGGGDGDEEDGGEAEPDAGGAMRIEIRPAYDCTFGSFAKEPGKDAFRLEAPAGYEKVADFDAESKKRVMQMMEEQGAMEEVVVEDVVEEPPPPPPAGDQPVSTAKPHAAVGKAAPAATLDLLDGSKLDLADLKGKVVLLDFWATWCAPCVKGLPKVAEIAASLKEQGLEFVAVNQMESKQVVAEFLAERKLDLRVALGTKQLASAFGVRGIPHTVVIGRDGVVRSVRIGFGPDSERALRADVEAALAAK